MYKSYLNEKPYQGEKKVRSKELENETRTEKYRRGTRKWKKTNVSVGQKQERNQMRQIDHQ